MKKYVFMLLRLIVILVSFYCSVLLSEIFKHRIILCYLIYIGLLVVSFLGFYSNKTTVSISLCSCTAVIEFLLLKFWSDIIVFLKNYNIIIDSTRNLIDNIFYCVLIQFIACFTAVCFYQKRKST